MQKKCRTTVKTIRHYDNLGVLKADYVSEETGYRYYRNNSVVKYYQILALKEAGFTLAEIKDKFSCFDPTTQLAYLENQILLLNEQKQKCEMIKKEYERLMAEAKKFTVSKSLQGIIISSDKYNESIKITVKSSIVDECACLIEHSLNEEQIINIEYDDLKETISGKKAFAYGKYYNSDYRIDDFNDLNIPRDNEKATDLIVFFETSPDASSEILNNAIESFLLSFNSDVNVMFSANAENSEKGLTLNWICFMN